MKKIKIVFLVSLCFVIGGCSVSDVSKKIGLGGVGVKIDNKISSELADKLNQKSEIKKFESLDEFKDFLENNSGQNNVYGLERDGFVGMNEEARVAVPMATKSLSLERGGGTDDFSETNVQVKGVDEADIIKNDGKYVYAVVKNSLYIADVWPADEAKILSKIEFKSRPQNIYINGNHLVIFGSDMNIFKDKVYRNFKRRSNFTFLKVFDISDRKNPKQLKDLKLEGNYTSSRMIGDFLYFVTNNYNYHYILGEPVLPRIIDGGEVLANNCEDKKGKCIKPNIYYFDGAYDSCNLTVVSALNIKDDKAEINQDIYTLASGQNIYVSKDNLYITYTRRISEYELEMEVMREIVFPKLSLKNRDRISQIEKVENFILSNNEKRNKITQIIERYRMSLSSDEQASLEEDMTIAIGKKYEDISAELIKTVIHKIAIEKGKLEYKTFGEVTGRVLNQFSMDESGEYFRIATTRDRVWSKYLNEKERLSHNNMYVLDKNLKTVGAIEKMAEGERIYSVRFMQNRAYMVTFEQVDPLFVIDLVNPKNPKVLGKLKIPGFSNYLHPYNDDLLIGIGKDTSVDESGRVRIKGVKLSLFDVSNVASPKEVDTYILGDAGSNSIALSDHKAFLFSEEKNLLAMPITIREQVNDKTYGQITFTGAVVFDINEKGFELKGKIDHSDNGNVGSSDYFWGYRYYDTNVLRTMYLGDKIYTFSNKYIKANNISDLELVKELELVLRKDGEDDDFEIIN